MAFTYFLEKCLSVGGEKAVLHLLRLLPGTDLGIETAIGAETTAERYVDVYHCATARTASNYLSMVSALPR